MQKDYSLLRQIDVDAVEAGEPICGSSGEVREFISFYKNTFSLVVVKREDGSIIKHDIWCYRMKPLGWLEGKPVYKDSVVYNKVGSRYMVAYDIINNIDFETSNSLITWKHESEIKNEYTLKKDNIHHIIVIDNGNVISDLQLSNGDTVTIKVS